MKARLFRNSMQSGHVARDYIRLVHESHNSSKLDSGPKLKRAYAVLESFEDQDRPLPSDPVVPIKRLVKVLTEGLLGIPNSSNEYGRINSAKLFRGRKVRLRGIPERRFTIREIYWDYQEVRVREVGTEIYYILPWDCLEFESEQEV